MSKRQSWQTSTSNSYFHFDCELLCKISPYVIATFATVLSYYPNDLVKNISFSLILVSALGGFAIHVLENNCQNQKQ